MHVADRQSSVSELLIAESLMGLSTLVCDLGATRLGVCDASGCDARLRRHLPQPVPSLLLRPLLVARERRGLPRPAESSGQRMTDGPLIVQSDKTLLLEIDHEQAQDCRKAIAPFAELERSPEHIHTYRLTPLGLWNARAAGHDAEQVVDTLLAYSRYAVPHALLVDIAETMARYGRLRLDKHPTPRPGAHQHRPAGPRGGAARQEGRADDRQAARRVDGGRAPLRARQPQAGAAQARLAGRGLRRVRRRRGARHRPRRGPAGRCAPTSARPPSRSGTAAPGSWCCPAAPARRSSAPPRWRRRRPPR